MSPRPPSFWAACLTLLAWAALPISAQTPSTGISLTVTPATVEEGNDATVSVAIGASRTEDVTVYVRVEPVAPAHGADYSLVVDLAANSPSGIIPPHIRRLDTEEIDFAISAGSTESSRTLTVITTDDDAYVGNRTLRVSARTEGGLLAPVAATLTITEDQEDRDRHEAQGICERTDQVETALLDAIEGIEGVVVVCSAVTDEHLAAITRLEISGRSLESLQSGDFAGLSELDYLSLEDTAVKRLRPRTFLGLTKLTTLVMHENRQLTSVFVGSFAGMPMLTELHITTARRPDGIADGHIDYLVADVFADLSALKELVLSGAGLYYIRAHAFRGLSKLQHLDLSYTGTIKELSAHAFAGLSSLRSLNMRNMDGLGSDAAYFRTQVNLPEGIFDDLTSLTDVDMRNTWNKGSLPDGLFDGLSSLAYVRFSNQHKNDHFPDRTFARLTAPLQLLFAYGDATLLVTLQEDGVGQFRAVAPSGAPFDITLPLSVTGGTVIGGAATVTIPTGAIQSDLVQVEASPGSTSVTVNIGELPSPPARTDAYLDRPFGIFYFRLGHQGYALAKSTDLPLTLRFRHGPPDVRLDLAEDTLAENSGSTTLTARIADDGPGASEELRFQVTVEPQALATAGDVSTQGELTIAAGQTESTGTVTISAVDNDRYTGDRTLRVSAAAATEDKANVLNALTLTIADDESAPAARLVLSRDTVDEGEAASVSARLDGAAPGWPVTLTVATTVDGPEVDFTQSGTTLTVVAGANRSSGTVTIATTHDPIDAPHKRLQVSATIDGLPGLTAPPARTLTVSDIDDPPTANLVLNPSSIAEDGGQSQITAILSHESATTIVLTVSGVPLAPAAATDFTQSGTTLTITAGRTASTGSVTITAADNDRFAGDRTVRFSATVTAGSALPTTQALTIVEDEPVPPVTLVLSSDRIGESEGTTTVTAELDGAIADELTLTVTAAAVAPALATEFRQSGTALTIAAGQTASTGTVEISGADDDHYFGDKQVLVTASVTGSAAIAEPGPVTLTIGEDEELPTLTLVLSPESIGEEGEVATVTATLAPPHRDPVTVTVTAEPDALAESGNYTLSTNRVLSFAGGSAASSGTVTITAVGDTLASPAKTVRIVGQVEGAGGATAAPAPVALTIVDDEPELTASLVLSADSIGEAGGSASVTATLNVASVQETTLRVTVAAVEPAGDSDFDQQGTMLTIPAGATASTDTVTVTAVDNDMDAPDVTVTISAEVAAGHAAPPPARELRIADDEATPQVQLRLSATSIGEAAGTSTVTARLSHPSSEATTVAVAVELSGNAREGDFSLSANPVLTIAVGDRDSAGTVTVTAVNDAVYRPDRTLTVTGTAANSGGVTGPVAHTLTIEEDEAAPTITLALSADTIGEAGGSALVTASVGDALGVPVTLAVTATAVPAERAGDFTQSGTTLTIATGQTGSTGTVRITAVDNPVDAPDRGVQIAATPVGVSGLTAPAARTLTITDDEATPVVTLRLAPVDVDENGGVATVSATIDPPSSVATSVQVSVAAVAPAEAADFEVQGATLNFAPAATDSTGTVRITAVDNEVYAPDKQVSVRGVADNALGATDPAAVELTIREDDALPPVRLVLSSDRIGESGGTTTVTAELARAIADELTLTVTAAAVAPALATEYSQNGTALTIAVGQTSSTGTVEIASVNDDHYLGDKQVLVTAAVTGEAAITAPAAVTLTIEEDEKVPTLTLLLSPESIGEAGAVATVAATAAPPHRDPLTVTVTAAPVAPADSGDYTLSANRVLSFAGGSGASSGTVTITAVGDDLASPAKTVRIVGQVEAAGGVTLTPAPVALTIVDDEPELTASLVLSADSIGEAGGSASVTATLNVASVQETTLRVTVAAVEPAGDSDFDQQGTMLTIPAGVTASTDTVTVTAVDNDVDAPDVTVTISAVVAAGHAAPPPARGLQIADDEATPLVELLLDAASIGEAAGTSTVTARLSHPSSEATTVAVDVELADHARQGDFRLSANRVLTIAADGRDSAGTVTVMAQNDAVYRPDRTLTVTGTAANSRGVNGPVAHTLTIEEDEAAPTITLGLSADTIGEAGGTALVTAAAFGSALGVPVTLAVTATGRAGDFTLNGTTLTIAARRTGSTGTVRITAVDNLVHEANRGVQIAATPVGVSGLTAPAARTLTIADDEATPVVTLRLSAAEVDENGGGATVSATIEPPSSVATSVQVSVAAVAPAEAADFVVQGATLNFAPDATDSTGTVRITAVDNDIYAPDKQVSVRGDAANAVGVTDPAAIRLTIREDEPLPPVRLVLSSDRIGESEGTATVTAELERAIADELTLAVTAAAVAPALATEFTQNGTALTIAVGRTSSTGTVEIAGADDDHYLGDKLVRVTAAVTGAAAITVPGPVTLVIEDDEEVPTLTLLLSPESIGEAGEVATVTATADPPHRDPLTVTVTAAPDAPADSGDYTLSANRVLSFAGGSAASSGAVTITAVGDELASPAKTVRIMGQVEAAGGVTLTPAPVALTIVDDEPVPTASLVLSTDAIGEAGGSASVTATLDGRSVQEITLRVTVAAVEPAGDRAFRQQGTMLTIPAGATASTDTVTVTAVDNDEDAPDVTVTISAEVAAGHASAPPAGTLTIADDDAPPRVRLQLSPASIGEAAGSSTVTASLSRPSSEATTVEVAVEPADNATAGDFSLSANRVLTIAAGARDSAGTVTVTAVNDDIFRPNRTLTVTGTAANLRGVTGPVARTLTIEEDEATPIITLALSADAIDEAGGTATVSATLGGALDRAVTVTVSAAPKPIAFVGQVDIGANRELTFVAGQVSSTGTVTITAVDNDIDAADTAIRVTAVVGGAELTAPAPVELTVRDDEDPPSVSLERSPATIAEDGGEATVVTALTHPSSADTIVQVTAQPVAPAQPRDFEQTGTQLAILAGETAGVWTVTIAAVDNDVDAPDRTVTVTGTAANAYGLTGQPEAVTIDIVDDEAKPTAHLILNPPSVTESSGSSTVTARLSHPSGEPTTVTVTVSPGAHTDADDFSVSTNRTLTIAADEHASTGTVTITAVDDQSYGPDGSVTVSATAVNSHGVGDLPDRSLTIEEDDPRPAASLVLSAVAIAEDGGAAAITVALDRTADVALTYTVRAAPVAPATDAHFSVAGEPVLTIPAGATESSGTVTITATSNDVDEPDRTVRVTAAPNAAAPARCGPVRSGAAHADDSGRRPGARGDAGAVAIRNRRARRGRDGDGDARSPVERGHHGAHSSRPGGAGRAP